MEQAFSRIYPRASLPLYFSRKWLQQREHRARAEQIVRGAFTPPFWSTLTAAAIVNHDFRREFGLKGLPRGRASTALSGIPVLVVYGSRDRNVAPSLSQELASVLERAGARVQLASVDSGHYPMIEQPAICANLVAQFLDSVE